MINNSNKKEIYELILLVSQYAEIENIIYNMSDGLDLQVANSNEGEKDSDSNKQSFSLIKREFWGKRNLAYKINKIKKADYHVLYFSANGDALKAINKKLKMNQDVIRFLFLKIKELPISNPPIMAGLLNSETFNEAHIKISDNDSSLSVEAEMEYNNDLALNWISYKNPDLLLRYISDIYLISSRKFNGLTAMQQRTLKKEVCIARFLAILPFTVARKR